MKLHKPIDGFDSRRINNTLHGRSVYRRGDVPGHNVFRGYNHPGTGDALDLAGAGWTTPVYAVCDGAITRWQFDTNRKEVIYFEGVEDGRRIVAVYAHINRDETIKLGTRVAKGTKLGVLRGDLNDPHLHFELWVGVTGLAVAGPTPEALRRNMLAHMDPATPDTGGNGDNEPSQWAKEHWQWAVANDLISDDNPKGPVTREVLAAVLHRYDMDKPGEVVP